MKSSVKSLNNLKSRKKVLKRNTQSTSHTVITLVVCVCFLICVHTIQIAKRAQAEIMIRENQLTQEFQRKQLFQDSLFEAKGILVMDIDSGEVLFDKNAGTLFDYASLVKIPVAYTILQSLPKDSVVTISVDHIKAEGDTGLIPGDMWTVQNLLQYGLVSSSNDAMEALSDAYATATNIGMLTGIKDELTALGLTTITVESITGLDTVSGSSASGSLYDLATLTTLFLQKYPDILLATKESEISLISQTNVVYTLKNTNTTITHRDDSLLVSKTGYTKIAGGNLLTIHGLYGRRILIIVAGSGYTSRFSDTDNLKEATSIYLSQLN